MLLKPDRNLVGSQIENANRHRVIAERADRLHIRLKMRGFIRRTFQRLIEKFRAVEANALAAVLQHAGHLAGKLDVGFDAYGAAVTRDRRQIAELRRDPFLDHLQIASARFVPFSRQLIRINNDHALGTINDNDVTAGYRRGQFPDSDHCRNPERARKNGEMAGTTAGVGGEREHVLAVKCHGLRGSKVACHNNHGFLDMINVFTLFAHQVAQQPLLDIIEITHALPQV